MIPKYKVRDFLSGPLATAGGLGLIPGWGTRSHKPQLKDPA